jgi:hypothetical protein
MESYTAAQGVRWCVSGDALLLAKRFRIRKPVSLWGAGVRR